MQMSRLHASHPSLPWIDLDAWVLRMRVLPPTEASTCINKPQLCIVPAPLAEVLAGLRDKLTQVVGCIYELILTYINPTNKVP